MIGVTAEVRPVEFGDGKVGPHLIIKLHCIQTWGIATETFTFILTLTELLNYYSSTVDFNIILCQITTISSIDKFGLCRF
jgi:hypothetical protein